MRKSVPRVTVHEVSDDRVPEEEAPLNCTPPFGGLFVLKNLKPKLSAIEEENLNQSDQRKSRRDVNPGIVVG